MNYYPAEVADQIDWSTRWRRHRIPQRLWGLGMEALYRTGGNAPALEAAQHLVDTFGQRYLGDAEEPPEDRALIGRGLILVGPAGAGKTRLACAAATSVHRAYNSSLLYMPVTNFFALNRDILSTQEAATKLGDPVMLEETHRLRELRKQVLRKPLLVWDDLGKEYTTASGWVGTEVHRVLRNRFDKGLPTIITTNVPLPDWASRYDEAMYSFLHEAFDVAALAGKDWRRAGK